MKFDYFAGKFFSKRIKKFEKRLDNIEALLQEILGKEEKIMAQAQEATDLLNEIKANFASIQTSLDNIVVDEQTQIDKIQALMDQIAAGTNVTIDQLKEVRDGSAAIKLRVEAIDTTIPPAPQTPPVGP